jgi:hypothetical protein
MWAPVVRAAQFAQVDPGLVTEVLARASFGESRKRCLNPSTFMPDSRADPPRLNGWMSLARLAQTSDVFLSP